MMSPPPEVSGYILPGLVSWKHLRRNTHPRELYSELKDLPGFDVRKLAWDFEMEKKAEKGIPEQDYENWVKFHIRRERQWFNIMRYLVRHHPCDLTAILLDGTDKILHMGWRFLDPQCPLGDSSSGQKIRKLCLEYFRELDVFLAEILETIGPEVRVFVASDHGFGPSRLVFRVNTWLHDQGYLKWKDLTDLDPKSLEAARRVVDRHFVLLDWEKTTAYAQTVTSNGIYIQVAKEPTQSGISPEQYEGFRNHLRKHLLNVRDPETGERVVDRVLTKDEAYPGKHNHHAPDLLLVMRDHSFISILNKRPIICRRPQIEGTHYPQGIFLAKGPGIKKGTDVPRLSILDVTPALLHSLGLEIPSDLEGRVPTEIFEDGYLSKNPVQIGPSTRSPESLAYELGQAEHHMEGEEEVFKQLKALGYLE
jgi:predicted AlkP superfamily phosphohydrolase/phosphomutase